MNFQVVLPAAVAKKLASLDRPTIQRIQKRIKEVAANPLDPQFSKALAYPKGVRSARIADWRIIFTVDTKQGLVEIRSIGSRGQIYRGL